MGGGHETMHDFDFLIGNWDVRHRKLRNNAHYPDLDDTAVVVMAMDRAGVADRMPIDRGVGRCRAALGTGLFGRRRRQLGNQLDHGFREGMKPAFAMALALVAGTSAAQQSPVADDHPVIELRQYKIAPGKRDAMIALFERAFVDSQEEVGARLVGQFRDMDDADRFTWIRAFPNMAARQRSLNDFYFGPTWHAHRGAANAMLVDNDNVLLLRPAWRGSGFAAPASGQAAIGAPAPAAGVVVAIIHYLWKAPDEGFATFFRDRVAPRLHSAGLPVIGAYVPEEQANNFPRLPVRQGEKLFVWFSRANDRAAFDRAMRQLVRSKAWKDDVAGGLRDAEERRRQVLYLAPTPRSTLR